MSMKFTRAATLGLCACLALAAIVFGIDPASAHGAGFVIASVAGVSGADMETIARELKAAADEVKSTPKRPPRN